MEDTYEIEYSGNPDFTAPADASINIKLVSHTEDETLNSSIFHPVFTHQFINQDERILGYKEPKVDLFFTSDSLHAYLKFTYAATDDSAKPEEVTDVVGCLTTKHMEWELLSTPLIAQKVKPNMEEFNQAVDQPFTPPGEHFHSLAKEDKQGNERQYEIYKVAIQSAPDYYRRLAVFGVFFIESATFLNTEDPNWTLYAMYERRKLPTGRSKLVFVGFCTTYFYDILPKFERINISQFVILPPFQRQGLGTALLDSVFLDARARQVYEVVVEDPTPEFDLLRNVADLRACSARGYFTKIPTAEQVLLYKPPKKLLAGMTAPKTVAEEKAPATTSMAPPPPKGQAGKKKAVKKSETNFVVVDDRTSIFKKKKKATLGASSDSKTSTSAGTSSSSEGESGAESATEIAEPDASLLIWDDRILTIIRNNIKLTRKQARMCYEIFKLLVARGYTWSEKSGFVKSGPESLDLLNQVRIDVKRRLYKDHLEALDTSSTPLEPLQRKKKLVELYAAEEGKYNQIIEMLLK